MNFCASIPCSSVSNVSVKLCSTDVLLFSISTETGPNVPMISFMCATLTLRETPGSHRMLRPMSLGTPLFASLFSLSLLSFLVAAVSAALVSGPGDRSLLLSSSDCIHEGAGLLRACVRVRARRGEVSAPVQRMNRRCRFSRLLVDIPFRDANVL